MASKWVTRGVKKLFSLTRTKTRLAREHETREVKPNPLPLVLRETGKEITGIRECEKHRKNLEKNMDYENRKQISSTVLQLMDIIEGIKHKYEPGRYFCQIDKRKFKEIEERCEKNNLPLNLHIMNEKKEKGIDLYVGNDPPEETIFLSYVPTSIAWLLSYCYESDYFQAENRLQNMRVYKGHRTLINNAITFGIREKIE